MSSTPLDPVASERLSHADKVFTSDLSISEFALLHGAGFEPLDLVMGVSVYHVGYQFTGIRQQSELPVLTEATYRARWNAELDLRSIKSAMPMRALRCQTPGLVRQEVWAHLLAYNLLRTVMAQAAARHDIPPRSISFTGAMQTLEAFQPLLEIGATADAAGRWQLGHDLLDASASPRVADRPDRYEPRVKKRRRNHYGWLTAPRAEMKRKMAKGLILT